MKKLESLIKIKNIQLNSLNIELAKIKEKIETLKMEANKKNEIIKSYLQEHSLGVFYMIDKLTQECSEATIRLENEQLELDKVNNEIIRVKQEIRALELLIEKRKLEIYKEKERIEQNELDELNSID